MTNRDYIFQMIRANTRIYIDTASLMDSSELAIFLESAADIFREEHKLIIVTTAVRFELIKHLQSKNTVKQALAMEAVGIIRQYEDIFCIEGDILDDQDIFKAFADAELLATLTLNKADGSQLLITNDKKLSKDAYSLNDQESCRGRKIMVCYINRYGELMRSRCVNEKEDSVDTKPTKETNMSDTNEKISNAHESVTQKQENIIGNILIPIGTFILGSVLGAMGCAVAQKR